MLALALALVATGCATAPSFGANAPVAAASGAPSAALESIVPEPARVFTLAKAPTSANDEPAPEAGTESATATTELDDECLVASWEGPIGNCLAPSLVIDDRCHTTRYAIHYNDCEIGGAIDTHGLSSSRKLPIGVTRTSSGSTRSSRGKSSASGGLGASAIRGTISGGEGTSRAAFDVEIDFVDGGEPLTVHLKGHTVSPR
ncbi:MAG: hypothetical protein U0414_30280 [Polyangiaceae bacterium]